MGCHRIDIRGHHVGLDFVALHVGTAAGVIDGVEERHEVRRPIAVSEHGLRDDGPGRGVGILAAVLANARGVPLDVAGIMRSAIERRREQQREPGVAEDEPAFDVRHGEPGATAIGGSANHAPGLGDRVDAAFAARGRAERGAVVEIAPAVPVAIPGLLERDSQGGSMFPPAGGACLLAARRSHGGKLEQRTVQ